MQNEPRLDGHSVSQGRCPGLAETVGKSTVLILAERREINVPLTNRPLPSGIARSQIRPLEDPWCIACGGESRIKCPLRACANGSVRGYEIRRVATNAVSGDAIMQRVAIRNPCPTCKGKGWVDCEFCNDGREAGR